MKLKTLLVILALVSAGAFILSDFYKDRAVGVSLKEIEARDKLSKVTYDRKIKEAGALEDAKNAEIAELKGHLDSNATYIASLAADKSKAEKELSRIRESWGSLDLVCQGKLKELDNIWSKRLAISDDEISVLKEDKRLLNLQLTAKDEIIASLHATLSAADDRIKSLEGAVATITGKYIRARNAGYLKTVVVIGLAVLAVLK